MTRNKEPLFLLLAVIVPPCAVITFLHKVNPIPLPPDGVLVLELTVNGSKMSNNSSFGIPIPSSPTLNSTVWFFADFSVMGA